MPSRPVSTSKPVKKSEIEAALFIHQFERQEIIPWKERDPEAYQKFSDFMEWKMECLHIGDLLYYQWAGIQEPKADLFCKWFAGGSWCDEIKDQVHRGWWAGLLTS